MSTLQTLWQAQLASIRNASRYDSRMRVAFVFALAFDIAVGTWSSSQLVARIAQWQAIGRAAVNTGLWSICMLTWAGLIGITVLECLQQGIGDDPSLLLFTLPIAPATRFRALYTTFFLRRLWNWLLLEVGITGVALLVTLGWQALSWLVLLQLGVGCVVYGSMVATMLVIRYILPWERVKTRIAVGVIFVILVILTILLAWRPRGSPLHFIVDGMHINVVATLAVARSTLLFVFILFIALGPLANFAGKLYMAAFLSMQSWDRSRRTMGLPGLRGLSRLLARYRNLRGALFVKSVLNQGRNVMFWLRLVFILLALFFFPQVHAVLAAYRFSDALFVVIYACGLALLSILEQAPNAFAGEGNRLALYLTAPFDLSAILRARLIVFLLPVLVEGLFFSLVLSWRLGVTISDTAFVSVTVILVITACTILPVWGSVWDENLNLAVEGTVQMMLQEEAAMTPKRLGLVNLSLLLFAFSLLVVWKLPAVFALIGLLLLDGLVLTVLMRLSEAHLRRLMRMG